MHPFLFYRVLKTDTFGPVEHSVGNPGLNTARFTWFRQTYKRPCFPAKHSGVCFSPKAMRLWGQRAQVQPVALPPGLGLFFFPKAYPLGLQAKAILYFRLDEIWSRVRTMFLLCAPVLSELICFFLHFSVCPGPSLFG